MKIDNQTRYSTRKLRTILCAVHRTMFPRHHHWQRVRVTIAYSRKGDGLYSGHAWCPGTRSHLSVPCGELDVASLVAVWRHELLHLLGVTHGDMNDSQLWSRTECDFVRGVMAGLGFERLGEEPRAATPPKPTLEEKRASEVERLLSRRTAWIVKARRAATALGKIDARLRRLSRDVEVPELEPVRKIAASKRRKR